MDHNYYGHFWRDGSDVTCSGSRLHEMLIEAIDLYSSMDVPVNKSSKLYLATKALANRSGGVIQPALLVAVAKLATEHLSIARMLSLGGCSIADVRNQLSHALSGGVIWKNDLDRRSESLQFELFVGSIFWAAGAQPEFREPDLMVELSGEKIGVASKYLFSEKKARKMTLKAVAQIRRSGRRGIIVCGLSQFVPTFVEGKHREDAGEPLDFSKVVPLVAGIDKSAEGTQGLIGRIAFIHTAAIERGGPARYIRRRFDARPYLDLSHQHPLWERSRWLRELRRIQNRWSVADAKMMGGKPALIGD